MFCSSTNNTKLLIHICMIVGMQASLWPSIPLVVHQSTIGTAMGLTTSLQMIGIGISNVCVGAILGKDSYDTYVAISCDNADYLKRFTEAA